jgi:hypothetical protein
MYNTWAHAGLRGVCRKVTSTGVKAERSALRNGTRDGCVM